MNILESPGLAHWQGGGLGRWWLLPVPSVTPGLPSVSITSRAMPRGRCLLGRRWLESVGINLASRTLGFWGAALDGHGGNTGFISFQALDKDGLREGLEGGGLSRNPTF